MQKTIVIVDNNPMQIIEWIRQQLKNSSYSIRLVIADFNYEYDRGKKNFLEEIPHEFVYRYNFKEVLDTYYQDEDTYILIKSDLKDGKCLEERINIEYVLDKPNRIWFYSTESIIIQNRLNKMFPNRILEIFSINNLCLELPEELK